MRYRNMDPLRVGDRVSEPGVVVLSVKREDPARHRHRNPDAGTGGSELLHERVEPFPGSCA